MTYLERLVPGHMAWPISHSSMTIATTPVQAPFRDGVLTLRARRPVCRHSPYNCFYVLYAKTPVFLVSLTNAANTAAPLCRVPTSHQRPFCHAVSLTRTTCCMRQLRRDAARRMPSKVKYQ
jgi:hypothetical protein